LTWSYWTRNGWQRPRKNIYGPGKSWPAVPSIDAPRLGWNSLSDTHRPVKPESFGCEITKLGFYIAVVLAISLI
jgi:hypothetical protein